MTRFNALNTGLEVLGDHPDAHSLSIVVVRWNRNARRKWKRMVRREALAGMGRVPKLDVRLPRGEVAFWETADKPTVEFRLRSVTSAGVGPVWVDLRGVRGV